MDNAASTTIVDYSGKGRDGTFSTNSNNRSVTGPNGYLTTALRFGDSSSDKITISSFSALNGLQAFSFVSKIYRTGDGGGSLGRICEIGSNDAGILWQALAGLNKLVWFAEGPQNQAYSPPVNEWHFVAGTKSATVAIVNYDGSETSVANTTTLSYTGNLCIGNRNDSTRNWAGYLAEFSAWSKTLSTAENGEIDAGPEPINTAAPSLSGTQTEGQILSCTSGTWGLDAPFSGGSNGTITYSYQWTRSNDGSGSGEANIGGATSSTYTLQAGDVGKYIRCFVRGTNDGGADTAADTPSAFTGAIASSGGSVFYRPVPHSFTPVIAHSTW